MAVNTRQVNYQDIDISFKLNPATKDISTVSDYNAVAQSIHNIITSKKLWNFDNIGTNQLIFNNYQDLLTGTVILTNIENYILQKEPRISSVKVDNLSVINTQTIELEVSFSLRTNNAVNYKTSIFVSVKN